MHSIDFYFGLGSRYSYLASTRITEIEAVTGAKICWRALYSPELIRRAGRDPFTPETMRGQYQSSYRSRDAARWADFFGVPYCEPDFAAIDWREFALWAVAAEMEGEGEAFARAAFASSFGKGRPPISQHERVALATAVGLNPDSIAERIDTGAAARGHEQNLTEALTAGCFGVPSFVVDDGELFWGQDRIVLLLHHLKRVSDTEQ